MILTGPLGDLVCCLDESGAHYQSPIVTTGGYIATASAWAEFERRASAIFSAYGVRYLHGVEFQNRKSPYRTWSPIKQRTFLTELFDAVRDAVEFGVTFSVRKSAYTQAKKEHGLAVNESGYGYAFRGALDLILRDEIVRDANAKLGVKLSFVLESGGPNEGTSLRKSTMPRSLRGRRPLRTSRRARRPLRATRRARPSRRPIRKRKWFPSS